MLDSSEKKLLLFLILSSLGLRILYFFLNNALWWDGAIYIGMGKSFFSNGTLGIWSSYRPILFPIILGAFWKLGINPLIIGKTLVIIASIGSIYVTYLIGKKINTSVGLIAATLLAFTPLYFMFSLPPMVDILSLFFSLLAVYLALENKYFLSGISIGLAFNFRFPHALTFVIVLSYILWRLISEKKIVESVKKTLWLVLGSALMVIPYLAYNSFRYHNAFSPLLQAQNIVTVTAAAGRGILYYFIELTQYNPLLLVALFGILLYFVAFKERNKNFDIILLAIIILSAYYSLELHKEARYGIAFLPYICVFAAYGFYVLIEHHLKKHFHELTPEHFIFVLILIGTCFLFFGLTVTSFFTANNISSETQNTYNYFLEYPGVTVLSTDPNMLLYSDIKLITYVSWDRALNTLKQQPIDYVFLDTCAYPCTNPSCEQNRSAFLREVLEFDLVANQTDNTCGYLIFKLNN